MSAVPINLRSVPLVDTGQDFEFALRGRHYQGRRYAPDSLIDLEQFVDFDAQANCLEYYFQDFLSPVDTIDLREIVSLLPLPYGTARCRGSVW